jgi:Fe-S oxidoreductase
MSSGISIVKEKVVFAPGCALMLYKPAVADKLHLILNEYFGEMDMLMTCCRHEPDIAAETRIINVCPGCNKRFGNDYGNITTISLWEIISKNDFFPFPDYHGRAMSIIDACPTREQERVHKAIRRIIQKMNIKLIEPESTRTKSACCGDSFYGVIPTEKVKELMIKRTSEIPLDDVIVYCVSCIKSVYNGGKNPQYLIDLLFSDETVPGTYEPDEWHKELTDYIEAH